MLTFGRLRQSVAHRVGHDLALRLGRRARRAARRVTGERVGDLIALDVQSAHAVASAFEGVSVAVREYRRGIVDPRITRLAEDEVPWVAPFRDECQTILLDIVHPGFSLRNELLHDPEANVFYGAGFTRGEVLGMREHAPRRCRLVRGTVAYLSNTWVDNYYHWLQLTLPLLRIYAEMRPEVRIDAYYVGDARMSGFQRETLARLGIRPDQIIRESCRADRILAAFALHPRSDGVGYRSSLGHEYVRARLQAHEPVATSLPKRLYVTRGAARTRRLANEPALIEFLSRHGFEPVSMEGRTVAQQAALFASAEAIIGVHGAALTNLLFASPHARCIEILPYDRAEASFFAAATHSGLSYAYVRCEPPAEHPGALVLDMCKFERLFARAMMGTEN